MIDDIRIGLPEDEDELCLMLKMKHEEDGLGDFNAEKVREIVIRGLAREMAVIGVIRGRKRIEASIGLYVGSWWYGDSQHLSDLWIFVRPEHRKTTHAKTMLQFAKEYSGGVGVPLVVANLVNEKTARKAELYQRQLGQPAGALFVLGYGPAVAQVA